MNDEIIGVAILDALHTPARLCFICDPKSKPGGHKFPSAIPIKMANDPDPIGHPSPWVIDRIDGDVIHVRPSVRIYTPAQKYGDGTNVPEWELFHNGGQWFVKFVRWHEGLDSDYYHALKQVNPGIRYE